MSSDGNNLKGFCLVNSPSFACGACLYLLSLLMNHSDQMQLSEERVCFITEFTVHHPRKPRKELKAGS